MCPKWTTDWSNGNPSAAAPRGRACWGVRVFWIVPTTPLHMFQLILDWNLPLKLLLVQLQWASAFLGRCGLEALAVGLLYLIRGRPAGESDSTCGTMQEPLTGSTPSPNENVPLVLLLVQLQ